MATSHPLTALSAGPSGSQAVLPCEAPQDIASYSPFLTLTVPLRTVSAANAHELPFARARRVKAERSAVSWALIATRKPTPQAPIAVTLTRCARSRGLDGDNLQASLKAVRDAVAAWLGVDDREGNGVTWAYGQSYSRHWQVEITLHTM